MKGPLHSNSGNDTGALGKKKVKGNVIYNYRVGMLSARTSIVHFCSRLKEATLAGCHCPASHARQET